MTVGAHCRAYVGARAFCRGLTITPTSGGRQFEATLAPVSAALIGSGTFTFRAAQGRETLCWTLTIQTLASSAGTVTMAHIRCETVDRAKVRQLLRNIDDFYVNVHTTVFPGGALQGTLSS